MRGQPHESGRTTVLPSSVFVPDFIHGLLIRARLAASRGELTFAVPELAAVANTIATDRRAGTVGASAARWLQTGASYHELVRLSAAYALQLESLQPSERDVYVSKTSGELEPLLALWPHWIALPTVEPLTMQALIAMRAFPVHPLGVVTQPTWADGRRCSPGEFFFHDLDHARFKIREDLLANGVPLEDAYIDGNTFDDTLGRHRVILSRVRECLRFSIVDASEARSRLATEILAAIDALADRVLAESGLLLAFEVIHEKSFPLDRAVLQRELGDDTHRHTRKLQRKSEQGFFGEHRPAPEVSARWEDARRWLLEVLE
jgi:hypothetical protein